jgi:dTDP-4-amino-4,6-dideoxygalactose transaminase
MNAFEPPEPPFTPFKPGVDLVHVAGECFGQEERDALIELATAPTLHLTAGAWCDRLERDLAKWFGVRYARLCNSGSSANLLAVSALCSPLLGDRRLVPGDEVITVAAGFPTTVAPIVQNGLVPVFVDVRAFSFNVDAGDLDSALSPRTRAVMLAHTLGNPFDLDRVVAFCRDHDLYLIEDNCDAAGSEYGKGHLARKTGTFGDLSTLSFYPAHHMTTGEGGAVLTSNPTLMRAVTSLRDWGRDCWCAPGKDNTCGKRFDQQHGSLPHGYDHKYCTPGDTLVETAEGLVPVNDLARRPRWLAASLCNGDRLDWRDATAFPTMRRDVWRVVLNNGMHLRYGFDHPVLTRRGYVDTSHLLVGDEVAVAGRLPNRPDFDVPDALLTVIGALISDGSYVPRDRYTHPPILWFKDDEACRTAFKDALQVLDVPWSLRMMALVRGYICPTGSRLHTLLTQVGVVPVKAEEKTIPAKLTGLSRRQASILLRALWSGDGTAKIKPDGTSIRIVYGSRSILLCRGIQRLLFQCGILSTVTSSSVAYKGERRPYHFTTVVGRESKRVMLDLLEGAPRVGDVAPLRVHLDNQTERATSALRNPSLEGDVWWVKVKALSCEGTEDVFDVTVNDPSHNYVAAGVVTHNCYSHLGYNLKMTDMQAAIGCVQLAKLDGFCGLRRMNWRLLREGLGDLGDVLMLPEVDAWSRPSWFGFLVLVRPEAPFTRDDLASRLEAAKIQTRPLFAGNLLRHPAMRGVKYRVGSPTFAGRDPLPVTDFVAGSALWVGVYPGITAPMIDWMIESFHAACRGGSR